jgi:hypothetical protein
LPFPQTKQHFPHPFCCFPAVFGIYRHKYAAFTEFLVLENTEMGLEMEILTLTNTILILTGEEVCWLYIIRLCFLWQAMSRDVACGGAAGFALEHSKEGV